MKTPSKENAKMTASKNLLGIAAVACMATSLCSTHAAAAFTWNGENQITPQTIALFHMNEGSGNSLTDATGHYTMTGSATWTTNDAWDTSNTSTGALTSSTSMSVAFTPNYTQDMTITAWVYSSGYENANSTRFGWSQSWNNEAKIGIDFGFVSFDFCQLSFTSSIGRDNTWHLAAISYQSATGTVTYYIDNQVVATGNAGSRNSVAATLQMTVNTTSTTNYIDEAHIRVGVAATSFSGPTIVPEPATFGLLTLGGLLMIHRRSITK